MDLRAFRARIRGRVQGVAFRYHTRSVASSLGITGFVRNLPNGDVEVVAEGDKTALEALLKWLEDGPTMARVVDVRPTWHPATSKYDSFTIDY